MSSEALLDIPPRFEYKTQLLDNTYGKVHLRVFDRICVDDVTLHLIRRELYRLAGGADPGDEVEPSFIDYVVREGYIGR